MLVQLVSLPLLVLGLAHADPRENAIIALSQGRELRAIQLLTDGVSAGGEGAAELRCLLGRVQHQAGRHQDALQTLAAVLPEAPCALGAGWVRAEAMLALGQDHEAGEVYAHLGEQALGPGRDARTVQRLVDLADRVMAREEPSPDQAAAALTLALQLSVEPETELALARRLADLEMARARDHRGQARSAVPVLAAALTRGAEVEDRRRLAALVGGEKVSRSSVINPPISTRSCCVWRWGATWIPAGGWSSSSGWRRRIPRRPRPARRGWSWASSWRRRAGGGRRRPRWRRWPRARITRRPARRGRWPSWPCERARTPRPASGSRS